MGECKFCNSNTERNLMFCSPSHKAKYYTQKRIERINNMTPEAFIKEELSKPIWSVPPNHKINNISFDRVVYYPDNIRLLHTNKFIKLLHLHKGDIVNINIRVLKRAKVIGDGGKQKRDEYIR